MLTQQQQDLSLLTQELVTLNSKVRFTKDDERRSANLAAMISAVKAGASLAELDQEDLNKRERAAGLRLTSLITRKSLTDAQEIEARGWMKAIEQRNQTELEGNLLNGLGTYTSLGRFVPTGFFQSLFAAMAASDFVLDEDAVTLIKSTNGRPLQIPTVGDTENVASVIGEAGSLSSVNLSAPGQQVLGSFSYATPYLQMSIECFQDLEASFGASELFKRFSADRLSRGISKDLLLGDGQNVPLGLLPTLQMLGITPVIAAGNSANTGGAGTGANSIGSNDLMNLISSLNQAYLASDKCAWVMNLATLATLEGTIDKYGNLLRLVTRDADGMPRIFGVPVRCSPSMPGIGASNIPVLLGDMSFWVSRLVQDETAGVQIFSESDNLIEKGIVGLKTFVRAHGVLAYSDANAPSPILYLQNHS